jgi:hypothetical protein
MSGVYIMILIVSITNGGAIGSIEFNSKDACENAKDSITDQMGTSLTNVKVWDNEIICVPKN